MDWKLFFQLLTTAVVAVAGSYLAHYFSARRDSGNERRKLRIQYLLDAYRRLESASNRQLTPETIAHFESATADIQLLGSPAQARLARQFAKQMAADGTSSLDALIENLRDSLRAELALEPIKERVVYIRISTA